MNTIAAPAASTAATTSGSRIEPPGWMIAVDARVEGQLRAVGEREVGVRGHHRAGDLRPGLLDREADGVDAAHLAGADADRRQITREHDRVGADVLADLPREQQLAPLGLGGAALADDLHLGAILEVRVAVLDEHPADDLAQLGVDHVRRAALAVVEDPHVGLGLEHLERVLVVAAREQHLDELVDERLRELAVDPAIDADHAAVGGHRIAGERLLVGLERVRAHGHAARVVVLDDHAGRDLELARAECRPASRSSRLLSESSLPPSWETIDRTCVRAPTCE